MFKIFISTIPFGEIAPEPIDLLQNTGWKYTINPLGRKLTPSEVSALACDADGIIAGTEDLRPLIKKSKKLKIISRVGIGLESVPLIECKNRGITVTYTPDAVTMAVAELTIGIMINLSRHVFMSDMKLRQGVWQRLMGRRIGESVIGIIGCGRIGSNVARLLVPFHPQKVLLNDIKDKSKLVDELTKTGLNVSLTDKEEIYRSSNIISLHIPYSTQTRNMINTETMKLFKKNSFLINLARGGIVNEADLFQALKNHDIMGAAIDVFEEEPYGGNLISLDNTLLTQHMGSCSFDCRSNMETQAVQDLIRYFNKEPLQNEVPPEEYEYQAG